MAFTEAIQILKQADDLKLKISRPCDLLEDSEIWINQQKLLNVYHQVIVLDLEYALDKKVELDLWNVAFKTFITTLQTRSREKKNARRADFQTMLTICLDAASGFYIQLLNELCNTFDLDFPFRRRGSFFGQFNAVVDDAIIMPQNSSCLYICQYCLVHLGDIARYRNERKQAKDYYMQAIYVSPTSGHPYNQLALLEASQGDKLATVYYYIRAIVVKNPFPASATNLASILNASVDKNKHCDKVQTKMSPPEFKQLFLTTHGHLYTATDLDQAVLAVKSIISVMTALVATQSFSKNSLIKMTAINLFALKHVTESSMDELTEDEIKVRELVLELIAGSLCAFLVPIHTLKMDETLLDYYALPAIKLLLHFIENNPDVLKEAAFVNRLQIWPGLCKLLNNVQKFLKHLKSSKYKKIALPEDHLLQGYLLFSKNFEDYDFREKFDNAKIENLIRLKRITNISLWLAELGEDGSKLIIKSKSNGQLHFEPGCLQPDPTDELLEEMKSFKIEEPVIKTEKKIGILKPQGSLEKAREERELNSNGSQELSPIGADDYITLKTNTENIKIKKNNKQNVALQSIFKKIEENKQVKFTVEEPDREKSVKFEQKPKQPPQQFNNNLPARTKPFNQNLNPFAFPPPPPPANTDYLNNLMDKPPPPLPTNFFPNSDMPQINTSIPPPPYKNMPYPPYNWKRDEPPPPQPNSSTWWSTANQNKYSGYPSYSYSDTYSNFNKQANLSNDIFHPAWNNLASTSSNLQQDSSNFEPASHFRQQDNNKTLHNHMPDSLLGNSSGGYSLFNTNSWSPNLASQLGSSKNENLGPQQSLFGNHHGPQSLAQLLEQQSQLNNKNG